MKHHKIGGVTLIELMVVVVIIGILASIAYPSYKNWTIQTRRSDAQIALTQAANQQERFFTECNYYAQTMTGTRSCGTSVSNGILGATTTSPDGHYILSLTAGTILTAATCSTYSCGYTLTADPNGSGSSGKQAGDGKFRIDSTGLKQWDKANNNFATSYKWTDK